MGRRELLTATNLPRLANEKVKSVRGTRHLLRVNPKRPVTTIRVTLTTTKSASQRRGQGVTGSWCCYELRMAVLNTSGVFSPHDTSVIVWHWSTQSTVYPLSSATKRSHRLSEAS